MAHLSKTITIKAPVEKVYGKARDPKHWVDWYVGLGQPETISGDGEVGTVVVQHYQLAGMSFPITNRVLEDHLGPEGAEWKGKIEGPLAGEQTIRFVRKNGGTEVRLDLDYTVPGSVLGKFADKLIIERLVGNSAENTLNNLKVLCE